MILHAEFRSYIPFFVKKTNKAHQSANSLLFYPHHQQCKLTCTVFEKTKYSTTELFKHSPNRFIFKKGRVFLNLNGNKLIKII